jgi:hypothetical protein
VIGLALNLRLLLAYGQQSDSPEQHHHHHLLRQHEFEDRFNPNHEHWRERVHFDPGVGDFGPDVRKPRRVDVEYFKPQDAVLEVLPREIQSEQLPSTPQLNAIMDRAMGKVKLMLRDLEQDRGRDYGF